VAADIYRVLGDFMGLRTIVTDGVEENVDFNWGDVLSSRLGYLTISDTWMLVDRYNTLTTEQQTQITVFRQALRDITDYHDDDDATFGANNAADNFPIIPSWL